MQRCRYVIKEISCAVSIDKSNFLMKLKQTKVPLRTTKNLVGSESCCWWLVPCLWLWYLFTFLQEMVMIMMMMFLMILMMMMVTCLDTSSWPTDPSTAATTHHVSQRPGYYCRQNHQLQSFEMIFFNHQKEIICVFFKKSISTTHPVTVVVIIINYNCLGWFPPIFSMRSICVTFYKEALLKRVYLNLAHSSRDSVRLTGSPSWRTTSLSPSSPPTIYGQ